MRRKQLAHFFAKHKAWAASVALQATSRQRQEPGSREIPNSKSNI